MGDFQKIYILQTDFEGKKIPALKKKKTLLPYNPGKNITPSIKRRKKSYLQRFAKKNLTQTKPPTSPSKDKWSTQK